MAKLPDGFQLDEAQSQQFGVPVAVNPQTGKRIRLSQGAAAPTVGAQTNASNKTREWLDSLRADVKSARAVREMGDRFLGYNMEDGIDGPGKLFGAFSPAATGGLMSRLPFVDGLVAGSSADRQAMEGVSSEMLRATIKEGQSGTQNSNTEQALALARFPNIKTKGSVNTDRVRDIQMADYLAAEKLKMAEGWADARHGPDGFEQAWAAREPAIRQGFRYQPPPRRDPGKGVVGAPQPRPAGQATPPATARPAPRQGPPTASPANAIQEARRAIQQGAPRAAVIQRLQKAGINPAGL
jgi:hypothetical protein